MAACRIVYDPVNNAVSEIGTAKTNYDKAAETFIADFHSAIAEMEGEAKDALLSFFDTDVKQFIETDMPGAVQGLQQLLEANLKNFVDVDKQIADCISGS